MVCRMASVLSPFLRRVARGLRNGGLFVEVGLGSVRLAIASADAGRKRGHEDRCCLGKGLGYGATKYSQEGDHG